MLYRSLRPLSVNDRSLSDDSSDTSGTINFVYHSLRPLSVNHRSLSDHISLSDDVNIGVTGVTGGSGEGGIKPRVGNERLSLFYCSCHAATQVYAILLLFYRYSTSDPALLSLSSWHPSASWRPSPCP